MIIHSRAYRHNDIHTWLIHTATHALKALIVSLLITVLSAVSLPALSYLPSSPLPFISGEASEHHRQREHRRRKEGAATRGHEKRERRWGEMERRVSLLIWDNTHTRMRLHTGSIVLWFCCGTLWSQRLGLMNVWPLFLHYSSFHLIQTRFLMLKGALSTSLSFWTPSVPHQQISTLKKKPFVDSKPTCSSISAHICSIDSSRENQRSCS